MAKIRSLSVANVFCQCSLTFVTLNRFCPFRIQSNILQLFVFTNAIRCSRLPSSLFYLLKFTRVSLGSLSIATFLVQLKKQIGQ